MLLKKFPFPKGKLLILVTFVIFDALVVPMLPRAFFTSFLIAFVTPWFALRACDDNPVAVRSQKILRFFLSFRARSMRLLCAYWSEVGLSGLVGTSSSLECASGC
jgi:hypothetical protein